MRVIIKCGTCHVCRGFLLTFGDSDMLSERKHLSEDMKLHLQLSVHDSTSIRYEIVVDQIEDVS